jgi:hypothetical protein
MGCSDTKCDDCKCNVKKEVSDLKLMARNWKRGYETWIQLWEDNEYVYQEFTEDIVKHLHPYIERLVECEYLTPIEAGIILEYCHGQVRQLREETEQGRTD